MAILLFFANLIALYYACLIRIDHRKVFITSIREAFIHASLAFVVFIYLQVHVLSFFNSLNFTGVLTSHIVLLLCSVFFISRNRLNTSIEKRNLHFTKKELILSSLLFLVFFLPLLYLCIIVPPNNSDAATCYLIRVEYWIKDQNIHHYPTENLFELYYNQFPQFLVVNTRLLSGSDYFTAIFQFFSYAGCILTSSLIAKELGGKSKSQIIAAVICMVIPQAILQSSAAMYDMQSAFAASVALLYLIRLVKDQGENFIRDAIIFSIAFSFTSYIKYSSVFFIFFFPVAAGIYLIKKNLRLFAKLSFILSAIFVIIHLSFFIENYRSFGSPVSPQKFNNREEKLLNERRDAGSIASGVLKNITVNFVTPSSALNEKIYNSILKIHEIIKVGINDPELNLNEFYEKYSSAISESISGNLSSAILFLVAIIILLWQLFFLRKKNSFILLYILCLLLGFIFFSSVFKFQMWNSRLQLPFFVLASAPTGVLLSGILKRKHVYTMFILFCILSALPYIYMNYGKPIVSYKKIRMLIHRPPTVLSPAEFNFSETKAAELLKYYHTENTSSFLRLNSDLSAEEINAVFNSLESVDYFRNEKSVMEKSRNEEYLVPGFRNSALLLSNYESICNYLYSTGDEDSLKVALVFGHAPEYPLIAMLRDFPSSKKVEWAHIKYFKLNQENQNFGKNFFYDIIVTNDSNFVSEVKAPVRSNKRFGILNVIELDRIDSSKFVLKMD